MSVLQPQPGTILDKLKKTHQAEDFFKILGVTDYDPKVLDVARLHILRRMAQYIVSDEELPTQSDDVVQARCKEFLELAYADFLKSSPIQERLFKVHKDAVAPKPSPNMVKLGPLK
jgi:nitrogenase-stabilizing/protective protein